MNKMENKIQQTSEQFQNPQKQGKAMKSGGVKQVLGDPCL